MNTPQVGGTTVPTVDAGKTKVDSVARKNPSGTPPQVGTPVPTVDAGKTKVDSVACKNPSGTPSKTDKSDSKPDKTPEKPAKKRKPRDKDRPKRPLSAYNIFFKQEREKILSINPGEEANKAGKRRRHRKSHGKISFAELGRKIGERWKALDSSQRAVFENLALTEKKRYDKEVEQWNKAQEEKKSRLTEEYTYEQYKKECDAGNAASEENVQGESSEVGSASPPTNSRKALSVTQTSALSVKSTDLKSCGEGGTCTATTVTCKSTKQIEVVTKIKPACSKANSSEVVTSEEGTTVECSEARAGDNLGSFVETGFDYSLGDICPNSCDDGTSSSKKATSSAPSAPTRICQQLSQFSENDQMQDILSSLNNLDHTLEDDVMDFLSTPYRS